MGTEGGGLLKSKTYREISAVDVWMCGYGGNLYLTI